MGRVRNLYTEKNLAYTDSKFPWTEQQYLDQFQSDDDDEEFFPSYIFIFVTDKHYLCNYVIIDSCLKHINCTQIQYFLVF